MKKSFLYILLVVNVLLPACQSDKPEYEEIRYFCGAEDTLVTESGEVLFEGEEANFHGGNLQSNKYAFEGEHSIQLDSLHQYGMSILLTDISKGEFFRASVWQKEVSEPGALVCKAEGDYEFSLFNPLDKGHFIKEDGWLKHVLQFKAVGDIDSLTFFIFVGGHQQTSYYDNLEIIRSSGFPQKIIGEEVLKIELPEASDKKIDKYVRKASKGIIIHNKYKRYVEGTIILDRQRIPMEMRLKGDWTDHLMSGSPSYRIKTNSGYAYKGLRSFSIQHPKTRNYLHEWFLHQLCESEDLLSTQYSFCRVSV